MHTLEEDSKKRKNLREIKTMIFLTSSIFIIRYLILILTIVLKDKFYILILDGLFVFQIVLFLLGVALLIYCMSNLKDYFDKGNKRRFKTISIVLIMVYALLPLAIVAAVVTSYIPIGNTPTGFPLWVESIVLTMTFIDLIPLAIALVMLSITYWKIRKIPGWNTNILIMPFAMAPLAIIRTVIASLKIVNIVDPTKFAIAWEISDWIRIIYGIIGMIAFAEIILQSTGIKPRKIVSKEN